MKPLVFAFKEYPKADMPNMENSRIRYDDQYNLNIDLNTGRPVIEQLSMGTETFTKSNNEGSDSDHGNMSMLMATETRTFTKSETSDSDADRLMVCMGTMTATRTMMESSDMDRA